MKNTLIAVAISLLFIASCKDTINVPDAQVITVNTSTSRVDTVKIFVQPNDTLKIETQVLFHPSGYAYTNITATNISDITLDTAGFIIKKYIQKPINSGVYDSLVSTSRYLVSSLRSGEIIRFNGIVSYSSEIARIEPYIRIIK